MKIVFMGTPEFALPALESLVQSSHEVLAVFCQPDRPKGRSKNPQPCPVKILAEKVHLPVFQPTRIRDKKWRLLLEDMKADVFVVAAFGQILSEKIIAAPRIACVNLHASLLPRWRGASPIHMAILEGDRETGVSLMSILPELDAGPVYRKLATPIEPHETRVELEQRLARLGASLLIQELPNLADLKPQPQNNDLVTFAPIIQKQDGNLQFSVTAVQALRMLRAFGDWPGVHCAFRGSPMKIIDAEVAENDQIHALGLAGELDSATPGSLICQGKKNLFVVMAEKSLLKIKELQPAGKKIQTISDFINGYKPNSGDFFEPLH